MYVCQWVSGWRGQVHYDPGPLIYQRPHLSDMLSTFLFSYYGRRVSLSLSFPENGSFGRSLMLMSRPGLCLMAVNTELTRLVVCLCTVVTRLKDGPCPKQLGSFQTLSWVPSQALTRRPCPMGLLSPVSTPSFPTALPALSISVQYVCEEFHNAKKHTDKH